MQTDKKKFRYYVDLRLKTILFGIFMLVVILTSIYIIYLSFIKVDDETRTDYTYNLNSNINYSVNYSTNNFFEEKVLGMNRQYATDLVNVIEIDFLNSLRLSKEVLVEYDYEITGLIMGTYSSDSSRKETELWTKNFTLLDKKDGKSNKKTNNINEKIELDFKYYNDIVVEFKRQLKLNIDAKFTAKMVINYKIIINEEVVEKTEELILEFPLNKAAFVITTTVPKPLKEDISSTYEGTFVINYPVLVAAIIFLIIALVLLAKYILRIRELNMKTEYQKKLNKILKNYGDIIAESKTQVDFAKYEVLEIDDFNDLVDIENEIRIPIIYYEKTADVEGWFVLVHGNLLYRYILHTKNPKPKHIRGEE